MFYVLGNVSLRFAALGTAKRNTASKLKKMLRLRDLRLRFESYAVKIIITICVNVLRFALCFFKFCEILRFAALHSYVFFCISSAVKLLATNPHTGFI